MTGPGGTPAALPYRRGVGIMLLDARGRAFAGQRIDHSAQAWQMPQGGIDPGESPRAAALRELHEEVGVDSVEILAESRAWHRYDLPDDLRGKAWGGRYRGQQQKWFAMRLLGGEETVDIAGAAPEFAHWRWIEPERLPGLIVPFKRAVYQAVVAEFRPHYQRLRAAATGG